MLTCLEGGTPFRHGQVGAGGFVVEAHHEAGGGLDGGEVVFSLEEGVAEGCGVAHDLCVVVVVMAASDLGDANEFPSLLCSPCMMHG